jgi:hypothetical protein
MGGIHGIGRFHLYLFECRKDSESGEVVDVRITWHTSRGRTTWAVDLGALRTRGRQNPLLLSAVGVGAGAESRGRVGVPRKANLACLPSETPRTERCSIATNDGASVGLSYVWYIGDLTRCRFCRAKLNYEMSDFKRCTWLIIFVILRYLDMRSELISEFTQTREANRRYAPMKKITFVGRREIHHLYRHSFSITSVVRTFTRAC